MAFTSGTGVHGHNHLLDIFKTYMVGTVGWTQLEYTTARDEATSVDAVAAPGTGYNIGDEITLTGGTFTTATVLTVLTLTGGAGTGVATVSILTPGVYTVAPGSPVAQGSVSPAGGSGATFTMTYDPAVDGDTATLSLEGPGNGAGKRVYINIDTVNDVGNGYYGWRMYYATDYDSAVGFSVQENASSPVYFNMWNNSIDYYIQGNSRHFKVEVQISTNFLSCYGGFLLPGALPSEYAQPVCVIASYPELAAAGVSNARNSSIADPGVGCGYFLRRAVNGNRSIDNHKSGASSIFPAVGNRAYMWPAKAGRGLDATSGTDNEEHNTGGFEFMKTNFNGESPLARCYVIDMVDGEAVGALDGVYMTTGQGRSVEQLLTVGGRAFRLFQRAGHTNPGDFFAVEEV